MRTLLIGLVLLMLVTCGGPPQPTAEQARGTAMAKIDAGLAGGATAVPTAAPDPTLTATERDAVKVVRVRGQSMTEAAQDLQAFSREIRATVAWKSKVRTAAQVITAGQGAIKNVSLSSYYRPLNERTQEIATNCAKPAEEILNLDVDRLSIAFLETQQTALQRWCVTEMDRLVQLSYESLK